MPQAARKSYVYAHIVSRINYILPFVAGHNKSINKKIMDIWVLAAKFIYGKNTKKLSYIKLFERVGFPQYTELIECAAATWMQKILYTLMKFRFYMKYLRMKKFVKLLVHNIMLNSQ